MADSCCNTQAAATGKGPFAWFEQMIEHCHEYAKAEKAAGRPVVGIMCEYTPRELIMAAGAVPVCLCGGSAKTIPAAEQHLPANLCPLIKSTYGYHVSRGNPFLEMADLVVGETTCDGKKKMYELMAESRPMYVLELPHKSADAEALAVLGPGIAGVSRLFIETFCRRDHRRQNPTIHPHAESRTGPAPRIGRAYEVRSPAFKRPAIARLQKQYLGHARGLATIRTCYRGLGQRKFVGNRLVGRCRHGCANVQREALQSQSPANRYCQRERGPRGVSACK